MLTVDYKERIMRKSTVIAKCLVDAKFIERLEDAEHSVYRIFLKEFPKSNFSDWNQHIEDKTAEYIIQNGGRADCINVKKFIKDLW